MFNLCGIVGFIKEKLDKEVNINCMLDSIHHRGPDEQNYFSDENVVLGHTRLSIVDIKSGQQPYFFDNLVIVFNGEIYNYNDIKSKLISNGYKFDTKSDTEVLLKAYHCFGNEFIDMLNGMYAFVIYNKISGNLLLSRDFFGIKPLYYYQYNNEFYFSSEIGALINVLKENDIPFYLELNAQEEYLVHGSINEHRIIENLKEVPKGSLFLFEKKQLKKVKDVNFLNENISEKKLDTLLKEELAEELNADIEVGILLSGGIDSSLLVALASQHKEQLRTYSIAFEDEKIYDESKYAKFVAKKFRTNHKTFFFNEDTLLDYLPSLIEAMDTPVYESSA